MSFSGECGADMGGPSKEFFHVSLASLKEVDPVYNFQLFTGEEGHLVHLVPVYLKLKHFVPWKLKFCLQETFAVGKTFWKKNVFFTMISNLSFPINCTIISLFAVIFQVFCAFFNLC